VPGPFVTEDLGVDAERIIGALGLQPHPEGGWYVETWRGPTGPTGRAVATAIHFLLRAGERSHWHRVDAAEIWLHHVGAPLVLSVFDGVQRVEHRLGSAFDDGQRPQAVVAAGSWQAAVSEGDWSLVSCVVAPGFEFDGFELAPPGWSPLDAPD
jgi:predicted cupin superfamily sugar epimerase